MSKSKAFTLIELLVVISIIALLLSIIMPALSRARMLADGVVCTANIKQLLVGWRLYAEANDDKMVGPYPSFGDDAWVTNPSSGPVKGYTGAGGVAMAFDENDFASKIEAIKRGALYPYVDNYKVYHCKGDRRKRVDKAYRSYSISGPMGTGTTSSDLTVQKTTEIVMTSLKYVFIEEADTRGWNQGSWVMNANGSSWTDPLAVWHNNSSTIGFSDGHAERHKWRDERSISYFLDELVGVSSFSSGPQPGNPDLKYMHKGYWPRR